MRYVCYISESKAVFDDNALEQLADTSSKNNQEYGVTGYLCFKNNKFFQYIEGDDRAITQLIKNIVEDPRHQVLYSLADELEMRLFPDWNMKLLTDDVVNEKVLEDLIMQRMEVMSHSNWNKALSDRVITIVQTIAKIQKYNNLAIDT
ncbi:BLUF domain-containing protein [Paraferrimonas sp. SM1919]|uniref:BLUF domain-containing protein n=1 Tax=Paraferrimonas sp. SM1919 TaxID=2662263 RepID=UPI0013D73094|nr:BLUF domain-containing protein [Paraferrimonas sp. SM1919]